MKLRLFFKTPDALYEAAKDAAYAETEGIEDAEERADRMSEIRTELMDSASKWIKFGEGVTLEIDTEKQTAIVLPCK